MSKMASMLSWARLRCSCCSFSKGGGPVYPNQIIAEGRGLRHCDTVRALGKYQHHHNLFEPFFSSSLRKKQLLWFSTLNEFRRLLDEYSGSTTAYERKLPEEVQLVRKLQNLTQHILHAEYSRNPNKYHYEVSLAIRMWLEVYDENAMEQAWTLLERYVLYGPVLKKDKSPTSTSSALSLNNSASDSGYGQQDVFNNFVTKWKIRWVNQRAYWHTPDQMFYKLELLVGSYATNHAFQVPLTSFQTLLQAIASGIVKEQELHGRRQKRAASLSKPLLTSFEWATHLAERILRFLENVSAPSSSSLRWLSPTPLTYNLVMEIWGRSKLPQAPSRVEALLEKLQQQNRERGYLLSTRPTAQSNDVASDDIGPNTRSYLAAFTAWANSSEEDAAERAASLLRRMIDQYIFEKKNNPTIQNGASSPHFYDKRRLKPDGECFGIVIWAFAKRGQAKMAQAVFQEQCQLFRETGDWDFLPTLFGMNALIEAWAEAGNNELTTTSMRLQHDGSLANDSPGIMAEQIISQMEILAELTGNEKLLPNTHTYRHALKALVKSCAPSNTAALPSSLEGPLRAEAMLRRMEFYYQTRLLDETPGVGSYGMVVDAWGRAGQPERAEALLAYLNKQFQEQGLREVKPNRLHYQMVINAWEKSNKPEAPYRATRLLEEMKRAGEIYPDLLPDSVTYLIVQKIWSKSQTKEGQNMVQTLMNEMMGEAGSGKSIDLHGNVRSPSEICRPSIKNFNTMLDALARTGDAEAAEKMLRNPETGFVNVKTKIPFEPDHCSYTTVMNAWSKSRSPVAPQRAQALFDELIQRCNDEGHDGRYEPTIETFTTLMMIHGNSKQPDSVDRASALFRDMKSRFEAGAKHLRPDLVHYIAMLNAWSKAGQAREAQRFLEDEMLKNVISQDAASNMDPYETTVVIRPDTVAFNTVIAAWANSNDPQAGLRAEQVLRQMQRLSGSLGGDSITESPLLQCHPDTISYNSTLQAWTKCLKYIPKRKGRGRRNHFIGTNHNDSSYPEVSILHRMELLLNEMMQDTSAGSPSHHTPAVTTPDRFSFIFYLSALLRCTHVMDVTDRIQNAVATMNQLGVVPNDDIRSLLNLLSSHDDDHVQR